jgi:hypothetical protein
MISILIRKSDYLILGSILFSDNFMSFGKWLYLMK